MHIIALVALKNNAAYEPKMVTFAKSAETIQHAERLTVAMETLLR